MVVNEVMTHAKIYGKVSTMDNVCGANIFKCLFYKDSQISLAICFIYYMAKIL